MKAKSYSHIPLTITILIAGIVSAQYSENIDLGFWLGFVTTIAMINLFRVRMMGMFVPIINVLLSTYIVIALIPEHVLELSLSQYALGIGAAFKYFFLLSLAWIVIRLIHKLIVRLILSYK